MSAIPPKVTQAIVDVLGARFPSMVLSAREQIADLAVAAIRASEVEDRAEVVGLLHVTVEADEDGLGDPIIAIRHRGVDLPWPHDFWIEAQA